MLTDGLWEGIGKKEDEGRRMMLFLLAQGAQEIVKWVVLLQTESCFQFSLFLLQHEVGEPNQLLW